MRELARCLVWTLALGAVALLLALFHGVGLAHADGPWAWVLLLVFWPHYLLAAVRGAGPGPANAPALFAAQFVYFLAVVFAVRRLRRGKSRWRSDRASQ